MVTKKFLTSCHKYLFNIYLEQFIEGQVLPALSSSIIFHNIAQGLSKSTKHM